jgi:hypothetical protein
MLKTNKLWLFMMSALLILSATSCSKKTEEKAAEESPRSTLEEIARLASGATSMEDEQIGVKRKLEAAGYAIRVYEKFPAQTVGADCRVILYADQRGKSGGVVYVVKSGSALLPVWHWYFDDTVPEAVESVELNDDGLWDVRIKTADGQESTFIQGESFAMTAAPREGWMAHNGVSSTPVSGANEMWKCFDGDSSSTWQSSLAGGQKAFLEVSIPFGVEEGVLAVRPADTGLPQRCTLYADGDKLQDIELKNESSLQMLQLQPSVKGAKSIRLEFDSAHGGGDVVAVAELGIK